MIFQSTLMRRWYNLWNPEQPQANSRWKSNFHFLPLCEWGAQNGQRAPGQRSVLKASHRQAASQPPYYSLKSWILLKKSTKLKTAQQDNSVFSLLWVSCISFAQRWDILCLREWDRHCVKTSLHTFLTSFPHFTLPMLEQNLCTSTSFSSLRKHFLSCLSYSHHSEFWFKNVF